MKLLALCLLPVIALAGCTPRSPTVRPTQIPSVTAPTIAASVVSPTGTLSLPSDTPSPAVTATPLVTLEPSQAKATIAPLLTDPMNCAVPCFWGIIPGRTSLDEARMFFSKLGFRPFEGTNPDSGKYFYTIPYDSSSGYDFSATLHTDPRNLVENIVVTPHIPRPKEGGPREWIAYSPETLIKRYGAPGEVKFAVSYGPSTWIDMSMYFDTLSLIVDYSGYGMNPRRFCPLSAPFDFVRVWIGKNPPDTPSFQTVQLEQATALTMDQFTQLMLGDPQRACFTLKADAFP